MVSPRNENTNCPDVNAGPLAGEPEEAATDTFTVTLAERLSVAVAMITTFVAALGAVYAVLAPLAACAGLNEPQDPDGVQLQSTPPFELSFATVAAMDVVAPRVNVEGGAVVRAMDVVPVLLLAGIPEPVTPHPERLNTEKRKTASARKVAVRNLRAKCTEVSLIRIVVGTHKTALLPGDSVIQDVIQCGFGQSGKILTNAGAI